MKYDVIIIGGGICGTALAYELSKYQNKILLLDKANDVAVGTTKANSGIVHAGYDPIPNTLMAKYNVQGNKMIRELAKKLDVPFKKTGSFVLAFNQDEQKTLEKLLERGEQNGVPELSILSGDEARALEPNLSEEVVGALYAKTAGVVSPWELALAFAEVAVRNGAEVKLNCEVKAITKNGNAFVLQTNDGELETKFVVNAAGIQSDTVASFVGKPTFEIKPSKGEYYLLDKSQGNLTSRVIFQCPNENGKGILVSPTAHGNLIVGPNAQDTGRDDTATSITNLAYIRKMGLKSIPSINFRDNIRNFAGLRANATETDFIIGEDPNTSGFFHIAGIKSPGLTAAPAIACDVAKMLFESGLSKKSNPNFDGTRKVIRLKELTNEQREKVIAENPLYGRVICRCETITEGEIEDALHSPLPPVSIDGVKRRCGTGMGRCQGGFCGVRVHEILARHYGVSLPEIMLDKQNSYILTGETKGGSCNESL
ncbi:NAD(P)/FAD-dependent oxidoreductase [Paludicola sp. MB14-C6]|uniref:NAD(P)/FAD-dependent oxidoreductase n=1 Tax=Paludihabitans sp. MB14-C6 TaxID=3070656 RepID=UPI0027DCEF40|nr:NAD(P)/FAD-dependent oxidoreductase [Paludicola sp. MB14-C6]WMJ23777.1 NAD(P)/FAD-dependent oxidoreductase [Paludicola sp. MB14-C6]